MSERCPTCLRPFKKDRSTQQNRYYWGVVVDLISEHTGFTPEETHEIIKHKFLSREVFLNEKSGVKVAVVTQSTTGLDTKDWENLMARVRTWASMELAVYIPEPNENQS